MIVRLALVALVLGWVLPGPRVVREIAEARENQKPVRAHADLSGIGEDWPAALTLEIHPDHGTRVDDGAGGRWLIQGGRVVSGTLMPPPIWVPDLEILALRGEAEISRWLLRAGVDVNQNELARCGERDCFVLGTRLGPAQVWVDKDRFDVLRVVRSDGRSLELAGYRDWSGNRFPSEIALGDAQGPFGSLAVDRVEPAPHPAGPRP